MFSGLENDRIHESPPQLRAHEEARGAGSVWLGVLAACGVLCLRWAAAERLGALPPLAAECLLAAAGAALAAGARLFTPRVPAIGAVGLGLLFSASLSAASLLSAAGPDPRTAVAMLAALLLLLYGGLGTASAVCCGLLCVLSPAASLAGGGGAGFDASGALGPLLLAGAGALAARKGHRVAAGVSMVLFYASCWGGIASEWVSFSPKTGGVWASAALTAGFLLFSLSFSLPPRDGGAARLVPGLANLCAYALSCLVLWKVTGGLSPEWVAAGALALLVVAVPSRSGAGALRDAVVMGGLLALAFLPRVAGMSALAVACLGLAVAARWKTGGTSLRRTEGILLLLLLGFGLAPGGDGGFRDALKLDLSADWAALLAVTAGMALTARIHDRRQRGFGDSLLGILCAAVAVLLWIHMMVGRHGAGDALPESLAAAGALFLGAGWLLGSPTLSAAAMLPVLAAHLCYHAFTRTGVPVTPGAAAMVPVTFLAAAAWEDYLRRQRAGGAWDLLALSMLPWCAGLAMAGLMAVPIMGVAGSLAGIGLLAAFLPVFFRSGGAGMKAAAYAVTLLTGLLFVAVYGVSGLEAAPQPPGPWAGPALCLSLCTVAGALWACGGRRARSLSAGALLLGTAALATTFFPLPVEGNKLAPAWCMALGFLLVGQAAGSVPFKAGGMLALSLALTLTLCRFAPFLRGGEPAVFAVLAGCLLLHPGLRRTALYAGSGGPGHAAPR